MQQFTSLRTGAGGVGYEGETLAETQHFAFWHSATPVTQYLSGEDLRRSKKAAEQTDAQMQANGAWKDYAQQMPLVRITWEDDAQPLGHGDRVPSPTPKPREFNASNLHFLPQITQGA